MKKIWDITQSLRQEIPVWPECPPFEIHPTLTISDDCPVNTSVIKVFSHTGTHIDAPYHFSRDGDHIDQVDLDSFVGPCTVVDMTHCDRVIRVEDIEEQDIAIYERVLFKTYDSFPKDQWDLKSMYLDPSAISYLSKQGCQLIGIDGASVDPQDSKSLDAHHATALGGIHILEGVVLDLIEPGTYELIALPLSIKGGDASPVRAILREL